MRRPKLCVIGVGALGSALVQHLRRERFSCVQLVDPDRLTERNLPLSPMLQSAWSARQTFPDFPQEAECSKATLLATAAHHGDNLPWRAHVAEIADVGWQDLEEADLLCCCTDSVLSRVETAWIARALRKPMLDGGVFGKSIAAGRVTTFSAAPDAACFLCGLREDRRAQVLGYAASASLGCRVPEEAAAMTGTLATLEATAGEMFARIAQWPSSFRGQSSSTRLVRRPTPMHDGGNSWQRDTFALTRSSTCPWHEGLPPILAELAYDEPLRKTLTSSKQDLLLPWPVCIDAACPVCGHHCNPLQRVAFVRRCLPCLHCRKIGLNPLRVLHQIGTCDQYASLTPRQLGQPPRHLYWLVNSVTDEHLSNKGEA